MGIKPSTNNCCGYYTWYGLHGDVLTPLEVSYKNYIPGSIRNVLESPPVADDGVKFWYNRVNDQNTGNFYVFASEEVYPGGQEAPERKSQPSAF